MKLTLDTYFPESDTVTVRMDEIGSYTGMLLFRYPDWVSGDAVVRINGKPAQTEAHKGSYIRLLDSVKSGDVITLVFTRNLYIDYAKDELISALSCMARYCLREDWGRMICRR